MKKNMIKLFALLAVMVWMMPVMVMPAFADDRAPASVTNVGNKLCPVSGDAVSGRDFVTYQGKSYGLCCPKCKSPFLNDPEKYIAEMEAKKKQISRKTY